MTQEKVLYFKMSNGEDLIGSLLAETKSTFIITKPLTIKTVFDANRNITMSGLHGWVPSDAFINCEFTLQKHMIVACIEATNTIKEAYDRYFSSPIDRHESNEETYGIEEDDDETYEISVKAIKPTVH